MTLSTPLIRARLAALSAALLVLLLAGGAALALSEAELEKRVQTITDDLRCPTCQGLSVKDSDASFSIQIREKVRHMVEEGQSDEDIKAYFVSRYGDDLEMKEALLRHRQGRFVGPQAPAPLGDQKQMAGFEPEEGRQVSRLRVKRVYAPVRDEDGRQALDF